MEQPEGASGAVDMDASRRLGPTAGTEKAAEVPSGTLGELSFNRKIGCVGALVLEQVPDRAIGEFDGEVFRLHEPTRNVALAEGALGGGIHHPGERINQMDAMVNQPHGESAGIADRIVIR